MDNQLVVASSVTRISGSCRTGKRQTDPGRRERSREPIAGRAGLAAILDSETGELRFQRLGGESEPV
jgi:hypothetical protein